MFKKVIGQDHSEPTRSAPPLPETRHPEPLAVPAPPSYGASPHPLQPAPLPPPPATSSPRMSKSKAPSNSPTTSSWMAKSKVKSPPMAISPSAKTPASRRKSKPPRSIVYGKVHGNLTATDRVELKASAEVVGDIKAKTLSIEAGAIFVGKSTVGTPAQAPAQARARQLPPKPPAKSASSGSGNSRNKGHCSQAPIPEVDDPRSEIQSALPWPMSPSAIASRWHARNAGTCKSSPHSWFPPSAVPAVRISRSAKAKAWSEPDP